MNTFGDWDPFDKRHSLERARVAGVNLKPGDRVRLWPSGRADIMDMALEGKAATIESIEQDYEDRVYLAVTIEDDPGKDFGAERKIGHRFFFRPHEVEPLEKSARTVE